MEAQTTTLYHTPLDLGSRFIRVILAEKKVECGLFFEKYWERREYFLSINPAGEVPVLKQNNIIVCGTRPIVEYLEETVTTVPVMGADVIERAESRRLIEWFLERFKWEVFHLIVDERVMKRLLRAGIADPVTLRLGRSNLVIHLQYINHLILTYGCLNTKIPTAGDFIAAAALSCLDYLGEIPWEKFPDVKEWYARIKCRPSFKGLLMDNIPLFEPAKHYTNLDF